MLAALVAMWFAFFSPAFYRRLFEGSAATSAAEHGWVAARASARTAASYSGSK
jgi:hypothetical protein